MTTPEILFHLVAATLCAGTSLWALSRDAARDGTPLWSYGLLSLTFGLLFLTTFARLLMSWEAVSDGWRMLAAVAAGLYSTAAAVSLAIVVRRRRRLSSTG